MAQTVLSVNRICKSFWAPRAAVRPGGPVDPRRRPAGRRDRLEVLRDISFDVPEGQTLGIIGANGSGKTTLLKILVEVMQPDSGSVARKGKIGALLELGAGFHPELTGAENVHLNGALLGLGRREVQRQLADIIAFAELERAMDQPIKHYSSGMVIRLGFAIASQMKPRILLLDETFAVGDARFQTRALRRIHEMRRRGMTLIMVSHNADLMRELTDRVIWLDSGGVAMDGEPGRVLSRYKAQCGSHLAGADRLSAGLKGERKSEGAPEIPLPVRIVGGDLNPRAGDADHEPGLKLESHDRLEVVARLEIDPGADLSPFRLECRFIRDDQIVTAGASESLGPLVLSAPSENLAGRRRITLVFDPIGLAKGDYEIMLSIRKDEDRKVKTLCEEYKLPVGFRIVTPLPYEFRCMAQIPGRWEG